MTDAQPGAASAHSAGNGKSRKGPAKTAGANIRDIAAAAGVSVAPVSRVMRGNAKVSDETRAKVEQRSRTSATCPTPTPSP